MIPSHLIARTPFPVVNNLPSLSDPFIHYRFYSEPLQHPLRKSRSTHLATGIESQTHGLLQSSFIMFFSMARLSLMAATLFLPIYVRAVVFSVDSFEGIAVGKPINLTWLGDKNV